MAELQIVITDAGRAEHINADNTGTGPLKITEVRLGAGQYELTESNKTQTELVDEIKSIDTIAGVVVSPDTIHVTIKDEGPDIYSVGEFALYTEHGTLYAVYSQPEADGWIIEKSPPATLLLSTDIKLADLNAETLEFGELTFYNPPASQTVAGVIRTADQPEVDAGENDSKAVTPKKGAARYVSKPVLNGGTKHQVLRKTGADNLAFEWFTPTAKKLGIASEVVLSAGTFAELQAMNTADLSAGQAAAVKGCSFRWDGDNWVAIGPLSVKAFGAVGDGVNNDSQSFQDAMDHVEDNGGGVVYVPPGDYNLEWTPLIGSNVHLSGAGRDSKLTSTRAEAHALISNKGHSNASGFDGASDWSISHLSIDTPNTNGIVVVHAKNVSIHDVYGISAIHHFMDFAAVRDLYSYNLWLDGESGTSPYQIDGIPVGPTANAIVAPDGSVVYPLNDGTFSDGIYLDRFSIRHPTGNDTHQGAIHFHREGYRNVYISNGVIENFRRGFRMDEDRKTDGIHISNVNLKNIGENVVFFPSSTERRKNITLENISVDDIPSGGDVEDRILFYFRACDTVSLHGIYTSGGVVFNAFDIDDCRGALSVNQVYSDGTLYAGGESDLEDGHFLLTEGDCDFDSVDINDIKFRGSPGRGIRIRPRVDGERHKTVRVSSVSAQLSTPSNYPVGIFSAYVASVKNCYFELDGAAGDGSVAGLLLGDQDDQVLSAVAENCTFVVTGERAASATFTGLRPVGSTSEGTAAPSMKLSVRECIFINFDTGIQARNSRLELGYNEFIECDVDVREDDGVVAPALRLMAVKRISSNTTYEKPPWLKAVKVTVVGAGGGGGSSDDDVSGESSAAAGGGGGGTAEKLIMAKDLAAAESVTVGEGGEGATGTSNAGSSGGQSSFGSHCSADGGEGGQAGQNSSTRTIRNASGGSASGGDVNLSGGDSVAIAGEYNYQVGFGGASSQGQSRRPNTSNPGGSGFDGDSPGVGGAGGRNNNSSSAPFPGGKGADGIVIIEEYA